MILLLPKWLFSIYDDTDDFIFFNMIIIYYEVCVFVCYETGELLAWLLTRKFYS